MSDPVNSVYPAGSPVDKSAIKTYEGSRDVLVLQNASEITSMALPLRRVVILGRSLYTYDSTDITSAHNGTTVLVDATGRRYIRSSNLADASSTEILAALDGAGLPATQLTDGDDDTVFGQRSGAKSWLTGSEIASIIDGALGGDDWREGAGSIALSSRVDYLPANAWVGMIGTVGRLVQMGDGTIRVCGQGDRSFNGDPTTADIAQTRVLGVPDDTTVQAGKIYMGASSGFFIDQNDYPWSWGRNNYGVLGDGSTTDRARPLRIEWFATNSFKVASIFPIPSGNDVDCIGVYFLEKGGTGRVAYLGSHVYGAAGDGTAASGNKTTPVIVGGGTPLTSITYLYASDDPTTVLARKSDGSWYGWGANTYSCLGISGSNHTSPQALTAMQGWVEARCTGDTTVALTSVGGGVRTAGNNTNGGLGVGNTSTLSGWQTPTGLSSDVVAIRCNASSNTTAPIFGAIKEASPGDRVAYLWGFNGSACMGDGTTTNRTAPYAPAASWQGGVEDLMIGGTYSGGSYGAVFIRTTSAIFAAGFNNNANLCIGITGTASSFTRVLGLRGTIQDWSCVGYQGGSGLIVLTDRGCFSGGWNSEGACGIGTTTNETVLQPLWVNGIMGPQGPIGVTGAEPFSVPTPWVTGTPYVQGPPASAVTQGGSTYICLVDHTAGTFATDLAAGKWRVIAVGGGTDVQDGAVTNAKLASVGSGIIKGRATAGSGSPEDLSAAQVRALLGLRERLTANRTYWVRMDGSDSNDGLADSAGGAFATIQKALDTCQSLDLATFDVTIRLGAGTYDGVQVTGAWLGSGTVTVLGSTSSPASHIIARSGGTAVLVNGAGSRVTLSGVTINGSSHGVVAQTGGSVTLSTGCVLGAITKNQLRTNGQGSNISLASYTIAGSAAVHAYAAPGGSISAFGSTVTLSGTPAFSTAFAYADREGIVGFNTAIFAGTSATGKRYIASNGGIVHTNTGNVSFLPGSISGDGTNFGVAPYGLYT